MNKQTRQWNIHAVLYKPANAGGVIPFPFWINRKWDLGRPARQGTSRQEDGIAKRFISTTSSVEHPGKHWDVQVGVVIDAHFAFAFVQAMQPPHILGNGSTP